MDTSGLNLVFEVMSFDGQVMGAGADERSMVICNLKTSSIVFIDNQLQLVCSDLMGQNMTFNVVKSVYSMGVEESFGKFIKNPTKRDKCMRTHGQCNALSFASAECNFRFNFANPKGLRQPE